jgi:hypothetical protein
MDSRPNMMKANIAPPSPMVINRAILAEGAIATPLIDV